MDFNVFKSLISDIKNAKLGEHTSHKKMLPKERIIHTAKDIDNFNPKKAAVLSLFYPNYKNETCFLLTLRAHYNGTHASQVSFPGGKFELTDNILENTAIRETYEEVGIHTNDIFIIKQMTDTFIPPSNFLVSPFIGFLKKTPIFNVNHEVDQLIEVNLDDLLHFNTISTTKMTTSYMKNIDVPCFKLNGYTVWGATAMILSEIKDLLKSI